MSKKKKQQKESETDLFNPPTEELEDEQLIDTFLKDFELLGGEQEDESQNQEGESDEDEESEDEELEKESEEEPEEKPEKELEEEPPKTYKVKGQEYTLEQLMEKGLLDDLVVKSEQVAHYQRLYEEAAEQARKEEVERARQAQAIQTAQQMPQVSPAQIQAHIKPQVDQAVKEGWMDEDFVEAYPQAAASQMFVYHDYLNLKQLVQVLYQRIMQSDAQSMVHGVNERINQICDGLVGVHEVYKGLGEPEDRGKFREYLDKVNPTVDLIDQEFLGRQYLAYQHDSILESIKQGSSARKEGSKQKKKEAAGEGSPAPRKPGSTKQEKSDDELLIETFLEEAF